MIRTHVAAVKAALQAAGLTAHDGEVPAGASLPYVVLYADQGQASSTRFDAASDRRAFRVQTTSVGGTVEQARWAAEKVQAALLDARLTIPGRATWPLRQETSRPIARDDDVTPPLFYAVDVWRLDSLPA